MTQYAIEVQIAPLAPPMPSPTLGTGFCCVGPILPPRSLNLRPSIKPLSPLFCSPITALTSPFQTALPSLLFLAPDSEALLPPLRSDSDASLAALDEALILSSSSAFLPPAPVPRLPTEVLIRSC